MTAHAPDRARLHPTLFGLDKPKTLGLGLDDNIEVDGSAERMNEWTVRWLDPLELGGDLRAWNLVDRRVAYESNAPLELRHEDLLAGGAGMLAARGGQGGEEW